MIVAQWTQAQEPAAVDAPGGLPTVCLRVFQQRNTLFQFIDRVSIHELFTSTGRIRRTALQSQARMVDGPKMLRPAVCHDRIVSKSQKQNSWAAHRRTVDGSGTRWSSLT
jgi:hypothetical protein